MPVASETWVIYYRKDLLEQAGLDIPTNLDELMSAAETIKAQNPGMAGFISRTTAAGSVTSFASILYAFGGDWLDGSTATMTTPESQAAYEYYAEIIREHGPDLVSTDIEWTDADALFTSGMSAFLLETSSNYNAIVDPASSNVSDEFGVFAVPPGPAGPGTVFTAAYALGISEFSAKKDEAWSFIQWATSREMTQTLTEQYALGMRSSSLTEAALANVPEELRNAIIASTEGNAWDRPRVIQVGRAREIVGTPIVVGIQGGDLLDALTTSNGQFQVLLDDDL